MVDQQSVAYGQYRGIRGVGIVAMILICAVVVLDIASTWSMWNAYGVVRDYLADRATESELDSADRTLVRVSLGLLIAVVVAGVFVVTWLWRARGNAEMRHPAWHRRARAWVIWGWVCPVVNFWFPYQIVDDVYRASRPDNSPGLADLRTVPGSRLVGVWWGLWVTAFVLNRVITTLWDDADSAGSLRTAGIVAIVESAVTVGAAVTFIMIMRQISGWQGSRVPASR